MEKIHNSEIIGSAKIIEIVDNRIFKGSTTQWEDYPCSFCRIRAIRIKNRSRRHSQSENESI